MGINSRVGIYYGILIDQYDAPENGLKKDKQKRFTYDDLEQILNSLFDFEWQAMDIEIDCNGMEGTSDFMVICFKSLSFTLGDHSSSGNYAATLTPKYMKLLKKPVNETSVSLMKNVLDELNKIIKNFSMKGVKVYQGFHILSFMD